MNSPHTGFQRMFPQERVYRHQLPDGRLTESYAALAMGLVLVSWLVGSDHRALAQILGGLRANRKLFHSRRPLLRNRATPASLFRLRVVERLGRSQTLNCRCDSPSAARRPEAAGLTLVPFVPIGEWRWLQRAEGASLIGLHVVSIPTAPTKLWIIANRCRRRENVPCVPAYPSVRAYPVSPLNRYLPSALVGAPMPEMMYHVRPSETHVWITRSTLAWSLPSLSDQVR